MPYRKRSASVKDRITEALCSLIIDDGIPYQQISIQELVDKAEVCRNSFYRNYGTMEDILVSRFLQVKEESDELFRKVKEKDIHTLLLSIRTACRNNRRFLLCFYQAAPNIYLSYFVRTVLRSNTTEDPDLLDPDSYYLFAGRAWILAGLATEWIWRDCDISPEQLAGIIEKWNAGIGE